MRIGCAVLLLVAVGSAKATVTDLRVIAVTGTVGPGLPAGTPAWTEFSRPSINNDGDVLFGAHAGHTPFDPNSTQGAWLNWHGANRLVYYSGMHAPGLVGDVKITAGDPSDQEPMQLADSGYVTFITGLDGSAVGQAYAALYAGTPDGLSVTAQRTMTPPGMSPPSAYSLFNPPSINSAGTSAFTANANSGWGLWTSSQGTTSLRLQAGNAAPTFSGSGSFFDFSRPYINSSGVVAFKASVSGGGISSNNRSGIWVGAPNNPQILAQGGMVAPGTGTTINGLSNGGVGEPAINRLGQVAFYASLNGPSSQSDALFLGTPGNLQLLTRRGDALPGMPAGSTPFGPGPFTLGDSGIAAFYEKFDAPGLTTDSYGVWAGSPGNLHSVALTQTQAPGAPAGAQFTLFETPQVDIRGDVVFRATLSGTYGHGVWISRSYGAPELLLRESMTVQIAPGDIRTVGAVQQLTGSFGDYGRSALDNSGEVALSVSFTDGSSAVIVVPEPTAVSVLVIGATMLCRRRRPAATPCATISAS